MSKLIVLPLEPLEMRYTTQWRRWFEQAFKKHNIDYMFVDGIPLTKEIETGAFLDAHSTNHWKLTQLAAVVRLMKQGQINSGDIIFDFDLWHSGLEAIPYVIAFTKQDLKIYGIWHAGTYDKTDMISRAGMGDWAKWIETGWGKFIECGFVGSKYHKDMIEYNRDCNVTVTGLPMNSAEITLGRENVKKKRQVVFTSRISPDKRVDLYERIKFNLQGTGIRFIETQVQKYAKEQYYDVLAESAVVLSTAEHEMFGIGVIEGMMLGCQPVVPNGLSYVDYVDRKWRYDTIEEATNMVRNLVDYSGGDSRIDVEKYDHSIDNMLKEMNLI